MGLPIFSFFYNRFIDQLDGKREHTSIYVAVGVLVTLAFGALFSWRASLLYLVLFGLSGLPMIFGEFRRTDQKHNAEKLKIEEASKQPRRKRIPYAANARIEDAYDAIKEAQRLVALALKNNGKNVESALPLAMASTELNLAMTRLNEVKLIQQIEE
jgi:hypothetical protein